MTAHVLPRFRESARSVLLHGLLAITSLLPVVADAATPAQTWTPVTARSVVPEAGAVTGVDGGRHVVYELELSNAGRAPASLEAIEVLDADASGRTIAVFTGPDLARRVRLLSKAGPADLEMAPDAVRLALLDLSFKRGVPMPTHLRHRLVLKGSSGPGASVASPLRYVVAPLKVAPDVRSFGPPLAGKGWVAINGCCAVDVGHRSTGLPIDGGIHFAQRFAIDWMKLDGKGRVLAGDIADPASYPAYGAEVLAIADATVAEVLDGLPDQVPPNHPPHSAMTLDNVLGNHVILKIDEQTYAVFAHLKPGSVRVKQGQRVRRGQVLGLLGNSGNTSAPHLHMHLMSGPSLGSEGLPYVIDRFYVAGQIPEAQMEDFYGFQGDWGQYLAPRPIARRNQFPLHFVILDFPK